MDFDKTLIKNAFQHEQEMNSFSSAMYTLLMAAETTWIVQITGQLKLKFHCSVSYGVTKEQVASPLALNGKALN